MPIEQLSDKEIISRIILYPEYDNTKENEKIINNTTINKEA